jgi:hypothetical protein
MPLNQVTISAKALSLFKMLKNKGGETSKDEIFSASKGWLIASGRELVGITLDFKGKLQAPTLKQRRIFQKS